MSPSAIVIHSHILKDPSFGFIPGSELIPVNQLDLERVKKAFCNGIVPAIALKVIAGILAAPVRMTDKTL